MVNGTDYQLPASMKGEGHYERILTAIQGQYDAILSHHCKVLVVRIDLHMRYYTPKSQLLSEFFPKLKKKLKKRLQQNRVGYIWCREQATASAQHYHIALMLDGNKNQKPHSIIALVEEIWQGWQQPKPYTPKNCYYLIKRDDEKAYFEAFDRMTYLAKVATKGNRAPSANDFNYSRLKPKQPDNC